MNSRAEYPRDSMTGLYRHDALPSIIIDVLNADLDHRPESITLLIVDVDRYKWILADCGTTAGDHFLIDITSIILTNIPPNSHVVRSSGAEFTILIPQITADHARQIAESLIKLVAAHASRFKNTYEDSLREIRGTITIGAVVAVVGNPDEMQSLLYWLAAHGYSSLRLAKKHGYGTVEVGQWMPPSQVAKYLKDNQGQ